MGVGAGVVAVVMKAGVAGVVGGGASRRSVRTTALSG